MDKEVESRKQREHHPLHPPPPPPSATPSRSLLRRNWQRLPQRPLGFHSEKRDTIIEKEDHCLGLGKLWDLGPKDMTGYNLA
jgi:hypothetical protein